MNPTISCKGLEEISTPQTLEIEGHIKKKKGLIIERSHQASTTSSPTSKG